MSQEPNLYDLYEKIGKTLCGIDNANSKVSALEGQLNLRHEENKQKFDSICVELSALKQPITDLVALKSRVGYFAAAFISVASSIGFFANPAMAFLTKHLDFIQH